MSPDETLQFVLQALHRLSGSQRGHLAKRFPQALLPELLTIPVLRLVHSVGVEKKAIAPLEAGLEILRHPFEDPTFVNPDGQTARFEDFYLATLRAEHEGSLVPRPGEV